MAETVKDVLERARVFHRDMSAFYGRMSNVAAGTGQAGAGLLGSA